MQKVIALESFYTCLNNMYATKIYITLSMFDYTYLCLYIILDVLLKLMLN